jgi:hypothetical protein
MPGKRKKPRKRKMSGSSYKKGGKKYKYGGKKKK